MSQIKSVISRTISYGSFSAITTFAIFLLHLVAARYLGVDDFGRFSFAIALVTLLAPILDPGIYYLQIREVARKLDLANSFLSHSLTWKILCSPLFFGIIYIVVLWMNKEPQTLTIVYLMAISQILLSLKDSFRSTLIAYELFNLDAISLAIERFSLLIFVTIALSVSEHLVVIGSVFIIVRLIDLAIIAIIVQSKVCNISLGLDLSFAKIMLANAIPIGAFYMTISAYNYIDTIMLSAISGDQEVGLYSASYKIYEGPVLIPAIIGTVFMPPLARLFIENKNEFMSLFENGLKYVIIVAIIVGINGIFLSNPIILLTFGEQYINSVNALKILLAGMAFVFTIHFLQTVLISIDMQKIVLYLSLLGLTMNVAVNLALIPLYGYIGAAVATISVEGLICVILCGVIHHNVAKIHWVNIWFKPMLAAIISLATVLIITKNSGLLVNMIILNITLILMLVVFKVFNKKEADALLGMIKTIRPFK